MISSADVSKYYHTGFFISPNYIKRKKGGYGTVYYDKSTSIIKKMARYNEINNLEENNYPNHGKETVLYYIFYPTIQEACFTKLLTAYPGFVILNSIHLSTHYLYLQEQFMGDSLHRFIKDQSSLHVPTLVMDILTQCMILEINGLQHTDLKTNNLLYQPESCTITMIDYNCMSIKAVIDKELSWTNSVGTWMYVAPEVACEEKITDTSIVWTLGMIIACLLQAYPVNPTNYPGIVVKETISKRKAWIMTLKNIFLKETEPYFSTCFDNIPLAYQQILTKIFYKHPANRISLQDLYILWGNTFGLPVLEDFTAYYHEIKVIPFLGWTPEDRSNLLHLVYDFCNRWNQLYKMCSIIHIIDQFSCHIYKGYEKTLIFAAWNIVSCWMNEHLYQYEEVYTYIETTYQIKMCEIVEMTWFVCDILKWDLYEKSTVVWLAENKKNIDDERILQVFIQQTQPYSMKSIASVF